MKDSSSDIFEIDLTTPVHAHFIGIGGVSMSGLAMILRDAGFTVSGSDRKASDITDRMEKLGIKVAYQQVAENINDDIDVVIYNAAIHPDNPEYAECVRRGLPMLDRAELVGQLMKNYKTAVAVAGTHGKTTTTSLVSHLFLAADTDPTISVGGILPAIGGNIRIGKSDNFITEACEYTNSFLKFAPTIGIILNIEEDHMDFFHDLDEIRDSFRRFAALLPEDGTLIINAAIDNYSEITADTKAKVITYGLPGFDSEGAAEDNGVKIKGADEDRSDAGTFIYEKTPNYTACDITFDESGCATFSVIKNGEKKPGSFTLRVPGMHNVSNALSVIALSDAMGFGDDTMRKAMEGFTGADRRFQYKGKLNGFTIIDDFAHHPTEIKTTLDSAEKYPHRELWVVFQPHTYSRTKTFLNEFADVLGKADHVILVDIYAAREPDPGDISSKDIVSLLQKNDKDAIYAGTFENAEKIILKNLQENDLLITMGAGNVVEIGDNLLAR